MNISQIQKEWSIDAKIDKTKLDLEAINIPKLHSKYINILVKEKFNKTKLENDIISLEHILHQFYTKQLTKEELKEYGLEYSEKMIMKPDVSRWINANEDMISLKLKLSIQNDKIELLNSILSMISSRSFHIRDTIEFMKFQAGLI